VPRSNLRGCFFFRLLVEDPEFLMDKEWEVPPLGSDHSGVTSKPKTIGSFTDKHPCRYRMITFIDWPEKG
jgi:hypothetical protein